jgi:hypothetical protein
MGGDFFGGLVLVAMVLAVMIALVVASHARIERFHREGPRPLEPRIPRDRHG